MLLHCELACRCCPSLERNQPVACVLVACVQVQAYLAQSSQGIITRNIWYVMAEILP